MILVDDYGWNNIGIHAKDQPNADEIVTPVMDGLAADGIILDRHYVYRFCSPSRSSFNTGRNRALCRSRPLERACKRTPLGRLLNRARNAISSTFYPHSNPRQHGE